MLNNSKDVFTAKVAVLDGYGLHARPAAGLAKTAQKFKAEICLIYGENRADAKSILDILALAVSQNSELVLECRGEDAEPACKALLKLFQSSFQSRSGSKMP
jgi:phosphocarrier protein